MAFIEYPDLPAAEQRSAEFWQSARGNGWQSGNVTQYLYARRYRTGDPDADADLPSGVDFAIRVSTQDQYLDRLIINDDMEPREAAAVAEVYPAWSQGGTYAIDDIVEYNSDTWKCRQGHTAFDPGWVPPSVPALWLRYRKNADQVLPWVAAEPVQIDTQRTYGGDTYICIQAHTSQVGWEPTNVPALWSLVVPPTSNWQAGTMYAIGDRVLYNNIEYECRQGHTAQVGWEPPNVPALWLVV